MSERETVLSQGLVRRELLNIRHHRETSKMVSNFSRARNIKLHLETNFCFAAQWIFVFRFNL